MKIKNSISQSTVQMFIFSLTMPCLAFLLPSSASANPGTEFTDLSVSATFQCISVYASFGGDDNKNNRAALSWRKHGGISWKQGMAMTVDRRNTVTAGKNTYPNPYRNQWRASILGLLPNTSYDVRVNLADPDGLTGDNQRIATISTRNDQIPLGNGKTCYVATDGDDANPGTLEKPLRSIQKGVNELQAGGTLNVRGGTYHELVRIFQPTGAPDNWISIQSYQKEKVILDGEDKLQSGIVFGGAGPGSKYIRLHGFTILNTTSTGILITRPASDIIVEDCHIEGWRTTGIYIGNWDPPSNVANIVLQRNTVIRSKLPEAFNGGNILGLYSNSGGHIIRQNILRDITNHRTNERGPGDHYDGIGGGPNFNIDVSTFRDSDVYDNTIEDPNDDAIETECADMNVRIWGNLIRAGDTNAVGIASAPATVGPLYIFRNVIINQWEAAFKQGQESTGAVFYYHNTCYTTKPANTFFQTDPGLYQITARNNILRCGRYLIEYVTPDAGPTLDFDYDVMFTTDPRRFVEWQGINYLSLAKFQAATGQEQHGLNLDATEEFVDVTGGDFHLKPKSQLRDTGTVIAGFNDQDSAWPYAGDAPDPGAFESQF